MHHRKKIVIYDGGCGVCGEDGEGFVEPTPCRSMRVPNFTTDEDHALCNLSKVIRQDAINGNEQQINSGSVSMSTTSSSTRIESL
jgi:hypothetical protein